jgi:hypothetical protein
MPIYKKFQPTTGTKAKRPKMKAKVSKNPNIDAEQSDKDFIKSKIIRESKLKKSNPSYTYLSLYHH